MNVNQALGFPISRRMFLSSTAVVGALTFVGQAFGGRIQAFADENGALHFKIYVLSKEEVPVVVVDLSKDLPVEDIPWIPGVSVTIHSYYVPDKDLTITTNEKGWFPAKVKALSFQNDDDQAPKYNFIGSVSASKSGWRNFHEESCFIEAGTPADSEGNRPNTVVIPMQPDDGKTPYLQGLMFDGADIQYRINQVAPVWSSNPAESSIKFEVITQKPNSKATCGVYIKKPNASDYVALADPITSTADKNGLAIAEFKGKWLSIIEVGSLLKATFQVDGGTTYELKLGEDRLKFIEPIGDQRFLDDPYGKAPNLSVGKAVEDPEAWYPMPQWITRENDSLLAQVPRFPLQFFCDAAGHFGFIFNLFEVGFINQVDGKDKLKSKHEFHKFPGFGKKSWEDWKDKNQRMLDNLSSKETLDEIAKNHHIIGLAKTTKFVDASFDEQLYGYGQTTKEIITKEEAGKEKKIITYFTTGTLEVNSKLGITFGMTWPYLLGYLPAYVAFDFSTSVMLGFGTGFRFRNYYDNFEWGQGDSSKKFPTCTISFRADAGISAGLGVESLVSVGARGFAYYVMTLVFDYITTKAYPHFVFEIAAGVDLFVQVLFFKKTFNILKTPKCGIDNWTNSASGQSIESAVSETETDGGNYEPVSDTDLMKCVEKNLKGEPIVGEFSLSNDDEGFPVFESIEHLDIGDATKAGFYDPFNSNDEYYDPINGLKPTLQNPLWKDVYSNPRIRIIHTDISKDAKSFSNDRCFMLRLGVVGIKVPKSTAGFEDDWFPEYEPDGPVASNETTANNTVTTEAATSAATVAAGTTAASGAATTTDTSNTTAASNAAVTTDTTTANNVTTVETAATTNTSDSTTSSTAATDTATVGTTTVSGSVLGAAAAGTVVATETASTANASETTAAGTAVTTDATATNSTVTTETATTTATTSGTGKVVSNDYLKYVDEDYNCLFGDGHYVVNNDGTVTYEGEDDEEDTLPLRQKTHANSTSTYLDVETQGNGNQFVVPSDVAPNAEQIVYRTRVIVCEWDKEKCTWGPGVPIEFKVSGELNPLDRVNIHDVDFDAELYNGNLLVAITSLTRPHGEEDSETPERYERNQFVSLVNWNIGQRYGDTMSAYSAGTTHLFSSSTKSLFNPRIITQQFDGTGFAGGKLGTHCLVYSYLCEYKKSSGKRRKTQLAMTVFDDMMTKGFSNHRLTAPLNVTPEEGLGLNANQLATGTFEVVCPDRNAMGTETVLGGRRPSVSIFGWSRLERIDDKSEKGLSFAMSELYAMENAIDESTGLVMIQRSVKPVTRLNFEDSCNIAKMPSINQKGVFSLVPYKIPKHQIRATMQMVAYDKDTFQLSVVDNTGATNKLRYFSSWNGRRLYTVRVMDSTAVKDKDGNPGKGPVFSNEIQQSMTKEGMKVTGSRSPYNHPSSKLKNIKDAQGVPLKLYQLLEARWVDSLKTYYDFYPICQLDYIPDNIGVIAANKARTDFSFVQIDDKKNNLATLYQVAVPAVVLCDFENVKPICPFGAPGDKCWYSIDITNCGNTPITRIDMLVSGGDFTWAGETIKFDNLKDYIQPSFDNVKPPASTNEYDTDDVLCIETGVESDAREESGILWPGTTRTFKFYFTIPKVAPQGQEDKFSVQVAGVYDEMDKNDFAQFHDVVPANGETPLISPADYVDNSAKADVQTFVSNAEQQFTLSLSDTPIEDPNMAAARYTDADSGKEIDPEDGDDSWWGGSSSGSDGSTGSGGSSARTADDNGMGLFGLGAAAAASAVVAGVAAYERRRAEYEARVYEGSADVTFEDRE